MGKLLERHKLPRHTPEDILSIDKFSVDNLNRPITI